MHLMYTLDANGKRIYTLKKVQAWEVTISAHPARFSPDDKYSRWVMGSMRIRPERENDLGTRRSNTEEITYNVLGESCILDVGLICLLWDRHRVTLKKRYGLLLTQQGIY